MTMMRNQTTHKEEGSGSIDDANISTTRPRPFGVERFFAKYEFLPHQKHLSNSDCETVSMKELLEMARDCTKRNCKDVLELWDSLELGYTESEGHPKLRNELKEVYRPVLNARGISPDDVKIMTCVPIEGIVVAMNALLNPNDVVIAMEPCYQVLSEIAVSRGCRVVPWVARFDDTTNLFKFDIQRDLRDIWKRQVASGRKVKMLILNSPHNPTGWDCTSTEQANDIRNVMQEFDALEDTIVFCDEMYSRILGDDTNDTSDETSLSVYPSFPSLLGQFNDKTIVLSGLSKPQGLPGLRVGWLITQDDNIFEKLCEQKDYATICGSAPSEILAIAALRVQDEYLLPRNRDIVRRNMMLLRHALDNTVEDHHTMTTITTTPSECRAAPPGWLLPPLFELNVSDGLASPKHLSCTLFIALGPRALERFRATEAFSQCLIDRFGICLVPGECFFDPEVGTRGAAGLRFGFGRTTFAENLAYLVECLWEIEKEAS